MRRRGFRVHHIDRDDFKPDELREALDGAAGYLIGGNEEVLAEHFQCATDLEAVAWVGTDYRGYVPGWAEAFRLGIAFVNAPGANAPSVAEFAMLLALTMSRPFTAAIAGARRTEPPVMLPGRDLHGRTLGVIGLGRIGARVASIARHGFGMRVVYTAPRRNVALENAMDITYLPKSELLSTADIVSLHRPALAAGEAAELGRTEFQLLRPETLVVNTGHLNLLDLRELLTAARTKGIRAAVDGLGGGDVWDALVRLGPEQFVAVPMMAFNTRDANERASLAVAEAVCDVLDGGTSELVNNPDWRAVRAQFTGGPSELGSERG